jgi:hypothetical protein
VITRFFTSYFRRGIEREAEEAADDRQPLDVGDRPRPAGRSPGIDVEPPRRDAPFRVRDPSSVSSSSRTPPDSIGARSRSLTVHVGGLRERQALDELGEAGGRTSGRASARIASGSPASAARAIDGDEAVDAGPGPAGAGAGCAVAAITGHSAARHSATPPRSGGRPMGIVH